MKNRIAIIGAGISGFSVANLLNERGHDVTVFETSSKPGGLVKCDIVDGVLFHRVGGHVFNTKNQKIENWFWNKFDQESEFIGTTRNAKILINNKQIGYPIENYLYEFDQNLTTDIINDFFALARKENQTPVVNNFNDFLKSNFGTTLFKLYFEPYNKKIWNVDLKTIPLPWLEGKLPTPNYIETILSNIYRKGEGQMVHSSFFYPKKNGSQFIVDRFSKDLKIQVNTAIKKIHISENQKLIINNNEFDAVIYTGDVRQIKELISDIQINSDLIKKIKCLRSNGTSNVLCEIDKNDLSWLYLPNTNIAAHRIIYTGNFSSTNNGEKPRTTCTIEFSGEFSKDLIYEEIKKLPGNPSPIAFNYEPNSYVIQDFDTRSNISKLKDILSHKNIYLLGRFAEWEYYNMDKAMEAAWKLVDEKF